jgi:hypothetical protein
LASFTDTNCSYFVNSELKKFVITGMRCGSSFCVNNLTPDRGWQQLYLSLSNSRPDTITLAQILEKALDNYEFYCITREPQCRITSGMDMVWRPMAESVTAFTNFEIFSNVMRLTIQDMSFSDIQSFGYANYTMGDPHISWGTHVIALILEALGITVTPLDLRNQFSPFPSDYNVINFNDFIQDLGYEDLKILRNSSHTESQTKLNERYSIRSNRFYNWIQTCSKFKSSGDQIYMPTYTVYDWLNADTTMYSNFLSLGVCDSRQQTATETLTAVMDTMWSKLCINKIFQATRPGSYIIKSNGTYPCHNLFTILYLLRPTCERLQILPEIFNYEKYPDLQMFDYKDEETQCSYS